MEAERGGWTDMVKGRTCSKCGKNLNGGICDCSDEKKLQGKSDQRQRMQEQQQKQNKKITINSAIGLAAILIVVAILFVSRLASSPTTEMNSVTENINDSMKIGITIDDFLMKWNGSIPNSKSEYKLSKDIQIGKAQNVIQKTFNENIGVIVTINKQDMSVRGTTIITLGNGSLLGGAEILFVWTNLITTLSPQLDGNQLTQMIEELSASVKNKTGTEIIQSNVKYLLKVDDTVGVWLMAEYSQR